MNLNNMNDGAGNPTNRSLDLRSCQFRIIFQATKELPNLPDVEVVKAGLTRIEADTIYELARGVWMNLEGASIVRVSFNENAPSCVISIVGAAESDPGLTLDIRLLEKWPEMIEVVLTFLGSRESFLRTGYSEEEIRAAAGCLVA